MEYAIVDIETTGGHASANGITEIAIILHDGVQVTGKFETLVNPHQLIPRYVESLTGITNAMVAMAPSFSEIADKVYNLLNNKVFVAHNVNFDYSFIKYHLDRQGIVWQAPKLCTVRLSRKVFPGHPSYSLGKICRTLDISVDNRHRAMGDALATTKLWEKLLAEGGEPVIREFLKRGSGEQSVPLYLDTNEVYSLPRIPGVYYFLDNKGDVVYVGKALDLRQRVLSHFSNNKSGRQKQEFLRNVHKVKYVPVPNELMAFLLEEAEIKRLWPRYNRSQKRPAQKYGLFSYEDGRGYLRLAVEKMSRGSKPLYSFGLITEGRNLLQQLVRVHLLCPRLTHIASSETVCSGNADCACRLNTATYNARVLDAIAALRKALPSYALLEPVPGGYPFVKKWSPPIVRRKSEGLFNEEAPAWFSLKPARKIADQVMVSSCILIEDGAFYGMGYVPSSIVVQPETLKQYLVPYPDNDYLRGLVNRHAALYPEKVVEVKI